MRRPRRGGPSLAEFRDDIAVVCRRETAGSTPSALAGVHCRRFGSAIGGASRNRRLALDGRWNALYASGLCGPVPLQRVLREALPLDGGLFLPERLLEGDALKLRPATIDDADLLFAWRNDALTREASHGTAPVARDEHFAWLTRTLGDPRRKLFVAEVNGVPVGTVRSDFADGVCELSWTVAPSARGRGVGQRMVAQLAAGIAEPIRAEVKAGNAASVRIAVHAGMTFQKEVDGVLHFGRGALARRRDAATD